jgi:glycosyltransferase involved in cell wall biosynthesis
VTPDVRGTWRTVGRHRALAAQLLRRWRADRSGFLADAENYVRRHGDVAFADGAGTVVAGSLPSVVPVNFRVEPATGREPFLNVLIPGMALWAMSGGPNTILNLTLRLARAGVPVRYVSTDVAGEADHDLLWEHLRRVTGIEDRYDNVEFVDGNDRTVETAIGADDVFLGTAWWTVQMIKHALPPMRHGRFLYVIQDFEPGLYAWSTEYALALETYGLDFHAIVNESLLMQHLQAMQIGRFANGASAGRTLVFEPAVDRSCFFPEREPDRRRKRLVFYARPSAPRNLFELGLAALKRAADEGAFPAESWELRFMGDDIPPAPLTADVVVEPLPWLDFAAYAELLRGSDVGLSLMLSPHTGYPVLELAACGAAVVTNTFGAKTAERLSAISPNIVGAEPTVEGVAAALIEAAAAAEAGPRDADLALPSTWEDVFAPRVPEVLAMIDDCRRA